MVIQPSFLNLLIVGLMVVIFSFLWRMVAAKLSDGPYGQAMAVAL